MPKIRRPMPKWTQAPPELVDIFTKVASSIPGVQIKKMFGYPAAFIGGHMCAGVFQDRVIVRGSEQQRGAWQEKGAAPFEPMPGRAMREYVTAPAGVVETPRTLLRWIEAAAQFATALPPKAPKAKPRKPAKR